MYARKHKTQTETQKMIQTALNLSRLEEKHQKPYTNLVKDYQKLTTKNKSLLQKNQNLETQIENKKIKLKKTQDQINEKQQHLKRITSHLQNIHNVPLDDLNDLALFIPTFQSLGYNPKTISLFAKIKDDLKELGFDPNKLEKNLGDLLALESKLEHLKKALQTKQQELDSLNITHQNLVNKNKKLQTTDNILTTNTTSIPCKNCNYPIGFNVQTAQDFVHYHKTGALLGYSCQNCGKHSSYSSFELLLQIANHLLPIY